jgi:hypothetical protein
VQQSAVTESRINAGQRQGIAAASVVVVNNQLFKITFGQQAQKARTFLAPALSASVRLHSDVASLAET